MASFQDYLKEDEITNEISEASNNQQARDEKGRFIPARFEGKDISDVVQSYEELEKLNSRQSQDLGNMRKQVDDLMAMKSPSPEVVSAKPLSVDDLYEDPDAAIRRVAGEVNSSEIKELRDTIADMRQKQITDDMDAKFPKWLEVSQSPEFATWCNESPYRQHMVVAVRDTNDLAAAQELLGMYYDHTAKSAVDTNAQPDPVVQQQLRDATLESGGPSPVELADTYSRNDLLDARLASKAGDLKAQRWLAANSESIASAYADGRIVD